MLDQPVPEGLHPKERSRARAVLEGLSTSTDPRLEQGKSVRESRRHRVCMVVQTNHSPQSYSALSGGGGGNGLGTKVESGKKDDWRKDVFKLCFNFSLSYSVINWQ